MRTHVMLVPVVLVLLGATAPGVGSNGSQAAPPTQVVEVSAERFSFTPSEIKTVVGTTLTIKLRSDDTAHGFRIVGTDVNVELPKRGRGVATATFVAERAGRYTFECSKLCGAGHGFMRGVIIVSETAAGQR